MDRARHRFAGVFAATFLPFLATGASITILPRFVDGPIGGGEVAVGVVIGAFAFGSVLSRPFAGRFADARGRRPVVIVGAVLMAVAGLGYALAGSVPALVVTRLILGAGEGLLFTAGSAWIVDLAPVDRRGQLIGLYGLAIWGGLSVGAPLGEAMLALGDYDTVWIFCAISPLLGGLVALRVPDHHTPTAPPEPQPLVPHAARLPGLALFLANLGYAAFAGFVVLHLERQGDAGGPVVFTAFAVTVVLSRLLLGRIPDRLGARRSAAAAAVAEAAGLAVVGLASSAPMAVAGAVLMGIGFSTIYPALALLVVGDSHPERRGAALGAFTAFFDAGVGLGGPLIGLTIGLLGYRAGFFVAAGCALAACVAAISKPQPVPVR